MYKRITTFVAACTLAFASAIACAQYPDKPIRLIVPFPAGSVTDTLTRVIAPKLSQRLGQNVIVENKAGANGAIAGQFIARAAPDGYTLMMGTNSPLAGIPFLMKDPPYNVLTDFTSIGFIGNFTHFLLVNQDLPVKNLNELLAYARANPGKLNFGSGHTAALIYGTQLKTLSKVDIVQVSYKGEPEQTADLLANRIQLAFTSPATSTGFIKENRLRALGVVLDQRSPIFPDVPTMAEAGLPNFTNISWMALVGPAKLPRLIVDLLNKELNAVLNMPDVREQLERQSMKAAGGSPEDLDAILKDQLVVWQKALDSAGIKSE
jgi:tripartite-type tricarboxylate transporter receptor subunit TctC